MPEQSTYPARPASVQTAWKNERPILPASCITGKSYRFTLYGAVSQPSMSIQCQNDPPLCSYKLVVQTLLILCRPLFPDGRTASISIYVKSVYLVSLYFRIYQNSLPYLVSLYFRTCQYSLHCRPLFPFMSEQPTLSACILDVRTAYLQLSACIPDI